MGIVVCAGQITDALTVDGTMGDEMRGLQDGRKKHELVGRRWVMERKRMLLAVLLLVFVVPGV